jgi:hypothetical protein
MRLCCFHGNDLAEGILRYMICKTGFYASLSTKLSSCTCTSVFQMDLLNKDYTEIVGVKHHNHNLHNLIMIVVILDVKIIITGPFKSKIYG